MSQREIERVFELLKLPVAPGPVSPNTIPMDAPATDRRRVVFFSAESTSKANGGDHAKLIENHNGIAFIQTARDVIVQ